MNPHIASWVAALAKLTTPHDAERAAAAMLAYMPFLIDLPDEAFTLASMRHVAMQERRMMIPDLREVLGPLTAHWRENRPALTALPAPTFRPEPARAAPSAEEREAVARQLEELTKDLGGTRRAAPEAPPVKPNYAPVSELAEARAALAARAKAARP